AGLELLVDGLDVHGQDVATLLLKTRGPILPGVEASGADSQDIAHQSNRPLLPMGLDEAVGHSASVAKKAVAFFKTSRSMSSRLFSARSRRSSSSRGGSCPCPGKA